MEPLGYPEYLRETDELAHPRPDMPMWSENYLSGASFPASGAGVWLHQCRPQHDPRFWEEVFTFMLPDDRFLVAKGATLARPGEAAAGPALVYECVRPFAEWRKSFQGLARLATGDELRAGPLRDAPHLAVDMHLTWTGSSPVFDMDMSEQSWADVKAHYQQHCHVAGVLEFGGERMELEGFGMRDHSWGPRDLARLGNHAWIYCAFPSGKQLMYFHHDEAGGSGALEHGHEVVDGAFALVVNAGPLPLPREPGAWKAPYALDLRLPDGTVRTLTAEIITGQPLSIANGSEIILGAAGPDASHHLLECPTRFEWDGEVGCGITEWTWRTR